MEAAAQLDREAYRLTLARHDELLNLARHAAEAGLRQVLLPENWVQEEEYSHSLHRLGEVGQQDVEGQLDTPEGQLALASLREDFDSSVVEMLHTDQEFRTKLELNRERQHIIHGGRVLAHDGKTAMAGLTANGRKSAELTAAAAEAHRPVAVRCAADERNALAVDQLPVGHMRAGISNYPIEAMARYGSKYYRDLGFREGLAFIQWYYRVDERTMLAGSYSVDGSDIATLSDVWAAAGGDELKDFVTDTWLDHAIELSCTEEQAREMILGMRNDFYQRRGIDVTRYSTDEFMAINKAAADQMFGLYRELARAYHQRRKNPAMQALVEGLLQNPRGLIQEIRQQLVEVQGRDTLDKSGVGLLEQLIRYATAEHLRGGLALLGTEARPTVGLLMAPMDILQMEYLARASAGNILNGALAGRTYGGCTRAINLSENSDAESSYDPNKNPQEAYGGQGGESSSSGNEICDYKHTGCYCCQYDNFGNALDRPVAVWARKRPGFVKCLRSGCGAYMFLNKDGNPLDGKDAIYKGAIYEAAQAKLAQKGAVQAEREAGARAMAAAVLKPYPLNGPERQLVGGGDQQET